eukprot:11524402-Karenia_brevis.AAC.1
MLTYEDDTDIPNMPGAENKLHMHPCAHAGVFPMNPPDDDFQSCPTPTRPCMHQQFAILWCGWGLGLEG